MTNTYARAYTEVIEILSHFSKEEYNKIPEEKISFYKNHMDKDYIYSINPKIDLSEQNISKEANAILVSLFRDYFATEKQRQTLNNLLNQNQEKLEQEKAKNYNPNNIFKDKKNYSMEETEEDLKTANHETSKLLIKHKENIFVRIVNKIKNIFRR